MSSLSPDLKYFAQERQALTRVYLGETTPKSLTVIELEMTQETLETLNLTRDVVGADRGLGPVEIPGGSGYELILKDDLVALINKLTKEGKIKVRRLRVR